MRRRREAYHARLLVEEERGPDDEPEEKASVTSIHLIETHKDAGLAALLHLDRHERRSGLVHLLDPATTPEAYASATATELGDFVEGRFELVELAPRRLTLRRLSTFQTRHGLANLRVEKRLSLGGGRLDPSLELDLRLANTGSHRIEALLGIAWDTTMLGGGGNPAAFWEIDGERSAHDISRTSAGPITEIRSGNDDLGLTLTTTAEPAAIAWIAPLETISKSESGFERVYQGSALLLGWPLTLEAGREARFVVQHAITVDGDRAADEAANRAGG
jgi:alpha-amylase